MHLDPVDFIRAALTDAPSDSQSKRNNLIRTIVSARAIYSAQSDGDTKLSASPSFPGYLYSEHRGYTIYVPFNLGGVFPQSSLLDAILDAAEGMRLHDQSAICISGSTTFLKYAIPYSDIDYCEYFFSSNDRIVDCASRKSVINGYFFPVHFRIGSVNIQYQDSDINEFGIHINEFDAVGKLDAIINCSTLGVVPASNIVIRTDIDYNGENVSRSFVHQEAMITRGANPRPLFHKPEIAAYIHFLREQAVMYLKKACESGNNRYVVKSMKRSISFLLLVGANIEPALADELIHSVDLLGHPDIARNIKLQRLDELRELASGLHSSVPDFIALEMAKIESQVGEGGQDAFAAEFWQQASDEARVLVNLVDDLISAAGISLD